MCVLVAITHREEEYEPAHVIPWFYSYQHVTHHLPTSLSHTYFLVSTLGLGDPSGGVPTLPCFHVINLLWTSSMHASMKELPIFGSPQSKPSFKFSFDVPSQTSAKAKKKGEKKPEINRVPPNKEIN